MVRYAEKRGMGDMNTPASEALYLCDFDHLCIYDVENDEDKVSIKIVSDPFFFSYMTMRGDVREWTAPEPFTNFRSVE